MLDLALLSRVASGLSLFITFLLLWLGMTTLLAARREQAFARVAGLCLLLGAAFFLSHAMIVGKGPTTTGSGMEFWWRIGWLPAVSAPLSWYATIIRYAGLPERQRALHRRLWAVFALLGLVIVVLLVTDNPFVTYRSLLVGPSGQAGASKPLVWLYLALMVAGFLLPVLALASGRREHVARIRVQARPWLIGAGVALLGASAIVAVAAAWAVSNALPLIQQRPETVNGLLGADLAAQMLVAGAAILLGRAVVAYEVFTERPLPRQGFFRRWRSVVLTAAISAGLITLLLAAEVRPLYSLTALSLLGMTAYALFTWQSYRAHERFISRLLPFVRSQALSQQLLSPDPPGSFSQQAIELLRALCEDALGTKAADLILEGDPPRRISYRRPGAGAITAPLEDPGLRLELSTGHSTTGTLLLASRLDRRTYAAEEIELARACGERLLDTVAGERIAHLLMDLLRRRLGELQVLGTRHKRVLHDEVLPDIHLALLRLGDAPEASQALARAHRTISELLHAGPRPAAGQIESRGLIGAIRDAVERDFAAEFHSLAWEIDEGFGALPIGEVSGLVSEVVYFAAQEAVRNAARHASGDNPRRPVNLRIAAAWKDGLEIIVADDGVGFRTDARHPGSREGLLFHSTMMAVVGGKLTIESAPEGTGTLVRLWTPIEALRATPEGLPPHADSAPGPSD